MANKPIRKLAAIMFTDIAGYTETMSQSEQKALKMLRNKKLSNPWKKHDNLPL